MEIPSSLDAHQPASCEDPDGVRRVQPLDATLKSTSQAYVNNVLIPRAHRVVKFETLFANVDAGADPMSVVEIDRHQHGIFLEDVCFLGPARNTLVPFSLELGVEE